MKLLIVDDSAAMRRTIRSIVANADDEVTECEDGSEIVDVYKEIQPDFVLMDIKMPYMNGIEATSNLITKFPEARVLIVSNYNDEELREEAKSAGVEKYFIKDDLMEVKNYIQQAEKL